MMFKMRTKGQRGFTIVELIMVIVVLGVLATFALPRFPKWNSKAREAAVSGLEGAVYSAAALAHATQLAAGLSAGAAVSMDGLTIDMQHEYPRGKNGGINNAIRSYRGFDWTLTGAHSIFKFATATSPGSCYVIYAQSTNTGMAATISSNTAGC